MTRWIEIQARRALHRVVIGRPRRRGAPEAGRFLKSEVRRVFQRAIQLFDEGRRTTVLPPGRGARRNVTAGIWSLALFRAFKEELGDGDYAAELVTDYLWLAYERSAAVFRIVSRVLVRNPRRRLHLFVRLGLIYPFGRPGYEWTARTVGPALETDFRRCPVWDYFRTQDEEAREFFRRSWCTLDFPLAEALVDGGRYERAHSLSRGDDVCDMRWVVPPAK
jgi:hypothetical protein